MEGWDETTMTSAIEGVRFEEMPISEALRLDDLMEALTEVDGVGLKTAAKIVHEYRTVDEILAAGVSGITDIERVGVGLAEDVIDHAEHMEAADGGG